MFNFRTLARDERGNVTLLGALSLVGIVGLSAFAVELGQGYSARVSNQRAADMAALGAAMAYSGSQTESVMTATAKSIAAAQGILATQVVSTLINSPTGDGSQAVQVTVTTPLALRLARVFTSTASLNISATSIASLSGGGSACILALSKAVTTGISLAGNTAMTATDCGIAANVNIAAVGSSKVIGKTVKTGGSTSTAGTSSITTSPTAGKVTQGVQNAAVDPLSGSTEISGATALLGTYSEPAAAVVAVTGTDFKPTGTSYTHSGYTGTKTSSTWTFPSGIYNIKDLEVPGGTNLVFQSPVTLNVSGDIKGTGASLTIGNGPVNVVGTVTVSGGSTLNIGAGRHYFGNIEHGGNTMTVGAGDLDIKGYINTNGSSSLTFGDGNVKIGAGTKGSMKDKSIVIGGSATLVFGNGTFSTKGSIDTSGGSWITFGETANHYINGYLKIQGAAKFGAGRYTINGDFTGVGGGAIWPNSAILNGVNIGGMELAGVNVTFVIAGKYDMGADKDVLFKAVAASVSGGAIGDIVIVNTSGNKVDFSAGSSSLITGKIYVPGSAVKFSGNAKLNGGGGCFQLIADTIDMVGSSAAETTCSNLDSGGSSSVMLLQ